MKRMKGYVILPCFTVEMGSDGEFNMTCNSFLGWLFEVFFAPFWSGKVKIPRNQFNQEH